MLKRVLAHVERVGEHADLADDFAGGQVPDEPHLAGEAERARHGAADLRRDAERHRRRVGDEHRFDLPAVGEPQQELLGAVGGPFACDDPRRVSVNSAARPRAAPAKVGHLAEGGDAAAVNPAEDLAGAEPLDAALSKRASSAGRSSSARSSGAASDITVSGSFPTIWARLRS